MKKYCGIISACILGLILVGVYAYSAQKSDFSAEQILADSKFKGRTFKGKTEVVSGINGKLKAYLMEEHSLPLVSLHFGFKNAGQGYVAKNGVVLMTETVMLDGAGKYNRKKLREVMREKGIRLSVTGGADNLDFSLSYIKEFERDALEILKAVLYEPHFNYEDMRLARKQLQAVRKQQQESPQYLLEELVRTEFYKKHPYGVESIPEDAVLAQVSKADIKKYLENYMTKDNLYIGFAGDIDVAEAEAFMVQAFGQLKSKADELKIEKLEVSGKEVATQSDTSAQSFVLMFAKGIERSDKDFYPLYIADYVFGGSGLTSRLNQAVREKEGLTYGIYSYFTMSDGADLWNIGFSATPENVKQIKEITAQEYRKFYQNGITAEELAQAKKSLMSSFNLRFAELSNISAMLKVMQEENLGMDFLLKRQGFIEKVSLQEVNAAIKNKLPKDLSIQNGVNLFEVQAQKKL